jgi:hypothetical protein
MRKGVKKIEYFKGFKKNSYKSLKWSSNLMKHITIIPMQVT